jgi:hypothetical protein
VLRQSAQQTPRSGNGTHPKRDDDDQQGAPQHRDGSAGVGQASSVDDNDASAAHEGVEDVGDRDRRRLEIALR